MATRINQSYWGAPNTYIYNNGGSGVNKRVAKVATILYPDVVNNHNELLNKQHDTSVTVWGMPADCSVARFSTVSWWSNGGEFVSEVLTPDVLRYVPMSFLIEGYTGDNICETWGSEDYVSFNIYSNRTAYGVSLYSTSGSWTNPDAGTIYYSHGMRTIPTQGSNNNYLMSEQVVSYDYRQNVLLPQLCIMPRRGVSKSVSLLNGRYDNIDPQIESYNETYGTTNDSFVLVGISFKMISGLRFSSADSERYYTAQNTPVPTQYGAAGTPSTRTRALYYANDEAYGYIIPQKLDRCIGFGANADSLIHSIPTSQASTLPTSTTYFDNATSVYSFSVNKARTCDNIFKLSQKKQVFDDVAYHWSFGLSYGDDNELHDFEEVDLTGMTAGIVNSISLVPYVVIDDDKGADNITAIKRVVLHELAFYGLPLVESQNAGFTALWNNAEETILIPLFDENMITTGEYVTLKQAFTDNLPQTTWTDIYTDDYIINHYDPDYQPEPIPDEGDSGDLINRGLYTNRFSNPSYTVWALYSTSLSNNGLDAVISAINNLYINDPDGNEKWTLDFKGSNPSDYIVGLYAYPLAFTTSSSSYIFTLGAVEFDTINAKHYADDGYFSFGDIDLSYHSNDVTWYGDFRDYPPYSTATLYIPFCGTVEIDLAFFIGHKMTIDMYYDIYTGACSAAVYRDNITLYKVINGQIGVQLPLTSLRAGDYQNNIHALENALKQNEMRLATSALTLGISAGAAVATGGASLAVGAGIITGAAGIMNNINERSNLEYKIEHTQPQIAQTGASETQNGYRVGGKYPKLYIKRAALLPSYNADVYGKTVGYACCINNKVGDNSGLIICSNVDTTGIAATADEIKAIKQALASGVII